jgi:hypothetical protein
MKLRHLINDFRFSTSFKHALLEINRPFQADVKVACHTFENASQLIS